MNSYRHGARLLDPKMMSCKIGTVPAIAWVHGRDLPLVAGKTIRVRMWIRGRDWERRWREVTINELHGDGYFKAAWI